MVEIRIHGRGGQGGVTLAKLIATSRFLQGRSVQAFGLYAAERSGAPIQAFCRFSDEPVTNRNLIYEPDHVIVLDPTLVGPAIAAGLKPGGWILLNTPEGPETFAETFPSNRVATVDATVIAREHGLGSRSVPIVNTALAGAVARLLDFPLDEMVAALEHMGFVGGNIEAAQDAHAAVALLETLVVTQPSTNGHARPGPVGRRGPSFVRGEGGARPEVLTGRWATEQPRRQQYIPPCNSVCPAGNDVQGFLHALAEEQTDEALEILLRTTPFPSVCGRVCPGPCMESCNRIDLDGAVNVRQLERFAGDHGSAAPHRAQQKPERVGIVGTGPAGLTAAYHLAMLGYSVTMYEAGRVVGGLLRTGIPEFRLPEEVVEREIDRILDLGVEVITDLPIDGSRLLDVSSSHDAVLVATGLQDLRNLRLNGPDPEYALQGIDFLDDVRQGGGRMDGEDVIVVGGGNTAMDAARSALRKGAASVRVLYRRTRTEMPAIAEEVDEAFEEGVTIDFLVQPVVATGTAQPDGDSSRYCLQCRRMELGDPDASGRRRPVEIPDSDFDVTFTKLILALGQSADLSLFPDDTDVLEGEPLRGPFVSPVYAVGDVATGEGTVAAAIGSGRRAALRIHRDFTGEALELGERGRIRADVDDWHDEVIRQDGLRLHLFDREPVRSGATLAMGRRRSTFEEVHTGLADAGEARRCLSCGVCNECDICVTYCPEGVLQREGGQMVFDYEYCKGCGICVAECPRNVLYMSHL